MLQVGIRSGITLKISDTAQIVTVDTLLSYKYPNNNNNNIFGYLSKP